MKDISIEPNEVPEEEHRTELPWLAPVSRRTMMRYAGAAVASSGIMGLLEACGGSRTGTSTATNTTTKRLLTAGISGSVASFDPAFAYADHPSLYTLLATNAPYVKYGVKPTTLPGGLNAQMVNTTKILPNVATYKWLAPDKLRLTFAPGMKFANGDPLDNRAAYGAFERQIGIKAAADSLFKIAGLTSIDQVSVAPDNSLDIHVSKSSTILLDFLAITAGPTSPAEMKQHATAKDKWAADYYKANLAAAVGPYKLASYTPGQSIVLEAYEGWKGDKPGFARVAQRLIQDSSQTLLLLKRGQIDVTDYPPVSQLKALQSDKNVQVLSWPSADPNYLYLNARFKPFENRLVRQAIAYATPYDDIIQAAYLGFAAPLKSILPPAFAGYVESWTYKTDIENAKSLLARAGFPGGEGVRPFTITYRQSRESDQKIALLIQQNLKSLGMKVEVAARPDASFLDQLYGFKLEAGIFDFPSFFWDAYYHFYWNLKSDSIVNFTNYKNDEVDKLIDNYYVTTETGARLEGARRIQELFNRDAPAIPLGLPNYNLVVRKGIKNSTYWNDANMRYQYFAK